MQITSDGILADSNGNPILKRGGHSDQSAETGEPVDRLGWNHFRACRLSQPGAQSQNYGQINLVATPSAAMTSLGGSLFVPADPNALQQSQNGSVSQGYLNASNVNPTSEMVELVDASRSYQLQTELMKTQSSNGQQLNAFLAQG